MSWLSRRSWGRRRDDLSAMGTLFTEAERIARHDGAPEVGAEHLVLAALDLDDGSADRVLERVDRTRADLVSAVAQQHAEALGSVGLAEPDDDEAGALLRRGRPQRGPHRSAPAAHDLFRSVVAQVRQDDSRLTGAAFVLALAQAPGGVLARVVRSLGVDAAALEAAARAELALLAEQGA